MTEQENQSPDPLLDKILLPGKTLSTDLVVDEERLSKLVEISKKKQQAALRRKVVNERLLRMVVKL